MSAATRAATKPASSINPNNSIAVAIRRSNKKKVKETKAGQAYKPASVIPGVEHKIEGRTDLNYQAVSTNIIDKHANKGLGTLDHRPDKLTEEFTKGGKKAIKANKKIKEEIKGFDLIDKERAKLRTVADPEDIAFAARKKAARRRMKGRLGTLLSNRETLG